MLRKRVTEQQRLVNSLPTFRVRLNNTEHVCLPFTSKIYFYAEFKLFYYLIRVKFHSSIVRYYSHQWQHLGKRWRFMRDVINRWGISQVWWRIRDMWNLAKIPIFFLNLCKNGWEYFWGLFFWCTWILALQFGRKKVSVAFSSTPKVILTSLVVWHACQ